MSTVYVWPEFSGRKNLSGYLIFMVDIGNQKLDNGFTLSDRALSVNDKHAVARCHMVLNISAVADLLITIVLASGFTSVGTVICIAVDSITYAGMRRTRRALRLQNIATGVFLASTATFVSALLTLIRFAGV